LKTLGFQKISISDPQAIKHLISQEIRCFSAVWAVFCVFYNFSALLAGKLSRALGVAGVPQNEVCTKSGEKRGKN